MFVCKDDELSLTTQCELLGISKSGLYYTPKGESEEDLKLMELMDKHHTLHPTHGILQMQDYLFSLNFLVNHKRVSRLMRKARIHAHYPKRNLSKLGKAEYIYPYLLRGLQVIRPNQVWAIDITYIRMQKGFMYMTAIIDVYSRYIVGWGLHNSLHAENVVEVLNRAVGTYGKPKVLNSDQGSQFTCELWVSTLKELDVQISMDGKGRATDNIYIERFWRTLKQDWVYLNPVDNGSELWAGINGYINYYNKEKTHQGIGRQSPESVYRQVA